MLFPGWVIPFSPFLEYSGPMVPRLIQGQVWFSPTPLNGVPVPVILFCRTRGRIFSKILALLILLIIGMKLIQLIRLIFMAKNGRCVVPFVKPRTSVFLRLLWNRWR